MSTRSTEYNFNKIEKKWQQFWDTEQTFAANGNSDKDKYYLLDMFPYPSGSGLHLGHIENYTASDTLKRFKKAQGYNVLHPMGWDAFGLPTEQYAIKTGTPPSETTKKNIAIYKKQLRDSGFIYDWSREVNTTDPGYFKWTQWIFQQLFKHGLAYVQELPVWYCPELGTVLANEEVLNTDEGPRSERGSYPVEKRPLRQWVLAITQYAEKLLAGLDKLDWPDSTKRLQKNWIGRSEGAEIDFAINGHPRKKLSVFTTRPDTLFGVSYMVIAPEHPLVNEICLTEQKDVINAYIKQSASKSDLERSELAKTKSGVFTGAYAINPINQERIPIWVADYVLMSYGTGAIMAVPAHDERDYAFATTFNLNIIPVIKPDGEEQALPFVANGKLMNSGKFDGQDCKTACKQITQSLSEKNVGRKKVNFRLRDWLFSRQRYWGEPFPIVWISEQDFTQLESMKDSVLHQNMPEQAVRANVDGQAAVAISLPSAVLPLELPQIETYRPSGDGQSPLAKVDEWVKQWLNLKTGETRPQTQPKPNEGPWVAATRETNTMPQWAGSCWYYLRYLDPQNTKKLIAPEIEAYWKTPDLYIGGAEHAVLHLLYARFWHIFLHDIGILKTKEPFTKLFHQGIILGEDGEKMSKSRGNVVSPDSIISEYGADTLRLYIMFLGPLEAKKPWNPKGIEGIARFLRKIWREFIDSDGHFNPKIKDETQDSATTEKIIHETIKKVSEDYEKLSFNTAISQMMIALNHLAKEEQYSRKTAQQFIQLLAPLAPHICEELWQTMGHSESIVNAKWPSFDARKMVNDSVKIIVQVNGKLRGELQVAKVLAKDEILTQAKQLDRVISNLNGKSIIKEIYVPGKIVNLVAR